MDFPSPTSFPITKKAKRKIGRALHDYAMLKDGDRVLVAVSGGVDSLVLACVLKQWLKKAPIHYDLKAVYIDNGFWSPGDGWEPPSRRIGDQLTRYGVSYEAVKARHLAREDLTCFLCARNRRSLLFDLAHEWGMNKIALGHHMDDLIETYFINMMFAANISTMVPKQTLFNGELDIIRPLAYLEKKDVRILAEKASLETVPNYCPIERDTKRERVRLILQQIYQQEEGAKQSIFRALSNVREDYMLLKPS